MIETCKRKGFDAVEYDNLDSWTRFDGTPREGDVPFGKSSALAFAALITRRAHALGLAVGQKNTAELTRRQARRRVGFDFAIAEECGRYRECNAYRRVYGNHVIAIEYRRRDFRYTCRRVGRTDLGGAPGRRRHGARLADVSLRRVLMSISARVVRRPG